MHARESFLFQSSTTLKLKARGSSWHCASLSYSCGKTLCVFSKGFNSIPKGLRRLKAYTACQVPKTFTFTLLHLVVALDELLFPLRSLCSHGLRQVPKRMRITKVQSLKSKNSKDRNFQNADSGIMTNSVSLVSGKVVFKASHIQGCHRLSTEIVIVRTGKGLGNRMATCSSERTACTRCFISKGHGRS